MIGTCGNISLGDHQEDSGVSFARYDFRFGGSERRKPIDLDAVAGVNLDGALQEAFVEEIRTGEKSGTARLSDGLNSLLVTLGCLKSSEEGRRVELDELTGARG